MFAARLAQANLITKIDFDTKVKSLKKINSNETKHLLVENELEKLQTFDSISFRGKSHFDKDGAQNNLTFQPMCRYFKKISGVDNGEYICFLRSKNLPDERNERINSITVSDYCITLLELSVYSSKAKVRFNGSCLKQNKIRYIHGTIVSIYIVYEINKNYNISSYPTLEIFLTEQLVWLKVLILVSTNILDIALDLIEKELFHSVMDLVETV